MPARRSVRASFALLVVSILGVPRAAAQSPQEVRARLLERVGDLARLQVPARDEDLPQPAEPAFRITPAKRRLGQFLFFDPIRSNNVRPEFGGIRALSQTSSCGSCHIGLAASKAGQQTPVGQGGEGFGFVDPETGRFVGTRAPRPGLVDLLPTPLQIFDALGTVIVSGRHDAVDRPVRSAPSVIGAAFNLRLLLNGAAGEPYDAANPDAANINPNALPAAENNVEAASGAHRMILTQRFPIQTNALYLKLFADAFPDETAAANASGNLDDLVDDDTIQRAIAAFMRTVITRDTAWDRFLAGDLEALTERQLRGAMLFATAADEGGAGCIACHSGPALNKTLGDEAGLLIEESFHNLGLGDHPMVALAQETAADLDFHDRGRAEATGNPDHLFRFKTPTLRQLADAAPYAHTGQFATLRSFLDYVNVGVPAAAHVAEAGTVSTLFTNPRSPGTLGLGLSADALDALEDFLLNALYDPAFVTDDPSSPTRTFEPGARDLTYAADEIGLGAVNGRLPGGLPFPNTDDRSVSERNAVFGLPDPALGATLCGAIGPFASLMLVSGWMGPRFAPRRPV